MLKVDPAFITSIVVENWLYPPPDSTTVTDVIDPFSIPGTQTTTTPSPFSF